MAIKLFSKLLVAAPEHSSSLVGRVDARRACDLQLRPKQLAEARQLLGDGWVDLCLDH